MSRTNFRSLCTVKILEMSMLQQIVAKELNKVRGERAFAWVKTAVRVLLAHHVLKLTDREVPWRPLEAGAPAAWVLLLLRAWRPVESPWGAHAVPQHAAPEFRVDLSKCD